MSLSNEICKSGEHVYVRPGNEVLHRCAFDSRRRVVILACRFEEIDCDTFGVMLNTEWSTRTVEWIKRKMTGCEQIVGLCAHCREREPSWKRLSRQSRRRMNETRRHLRIVTDD